MMKEKKYEEHSEELKKYFEENNISIMTQNLPFEKWIDIFLKRKGFNTKKEMLTIVSEKAGGKNTLPMSCLVDILKGLDKSIQETIRNNLIFLDMNNGNIKESLRKLFELLSQ